MKKKKNDYWIETSVVGSMKGNPFIKECLDYYSDRPFILENGYFDQKPIGRILADIAERGYGFRRNVFSDAPLQMKDGVLTLYPPYVFSHVKGDIRRKTCTIHLLNGSWVNKKRKENQFLIFVRKIGASLFNEKNWGIFYFKIKKIVGYFRP